MLPLETERSPELVVVVEASLTETQRLAERCAANDIATWIGGQECCTSGGCGPKAALMVQPQDAPKVAALLRGDWLAAVERERPGMAAALLRLEQEVDGDPACPACGTVGPLQAGACGDCGLQLE